MKQSKKILLRLTGLSEEVFELMRFELNMLILRLNNFFNPVKIIKINNWIQKPQLKLNVGAGPFGLDGWCNIDMFKMKNISFTCDIRRKLPFKNESVLVIRCEHCFEHLDPITDVPVFLSECFRILVKGGVLRIVVPDIEKFCKAYISGDFTLVGFKAQRREEFASVLTHVFRQEGEHKFGYDFPNIASVLQKYGFNQIIKQEFNVTCNIDLKGDLENHSKYSLYVDAVKNV